MRKEFSSVRINIFIIAVSALLMVVVLNLPFKAKPFGDDTFHLEAKNMALYLKGKVGYEKVTVSKAPGPVFFYTPAYLIAPANATDNQLWIYGVVFTSIIITISMILIFRIGSSFFSKEVGLLAVLLFFLFPIHSYYSLGILAEGPAFFSLSLALYGWSLAFHNPKKNLGWILLIIGMWFLIINRPNTMLLLGFGSIVIFYSWFKNKAFFYTYGKKMVLAFVAVAALGFGTLEIAKTITSGKTNANQEFLLFYVAHQGRFQFREEPTDFRFWDDAIRGDSKDYQNWVQSIKELGTEIGTTGKPFTEVYKDFLITDALNHPFWFTRQFFVKCFYGYMYFINSVTPEHFNLGPFHGASGYAVFIILINLINFVVIVGAIVFLITQKNLINYWLFWCIILSLLLFHGLTYMEPRYIFPSKVAVNIMSAAGLYHIGFIKRFMNKVSRYFFQERSVRID